MATTITPMAGALAAVMTGAAPTLTPLAVTTGNMVQLTTGTNVQFQFANPGNLVFAVYNSAASGGCTWSFIVQAQILGIGLANTAMECTTPSTVGVWLFGPFGPTKFNDANGNMNITQVTASATTSYVGVYQIPGPQS